jgi:hypothetical protein
VSCDRYIPVGLEADTDATAAVPDNALRIVAKGEKEEGASVAA